MLVADAEVLDEALVAEFRGRRERFGGIHSGMGPSPNAARPFPGCQYQR